MLAARGDDSLDYVLTEAAAGEVFAFGNSEAGNDSVLFDSDTVAAPLAGRRLRLHRDQDLHQPLAGMDAAGHLRQGHDGREANRSWSTPSSPGTRPGYTILHDWDTLGMRASQSNTTVLDGAVAPAERIFRKLPVGPNADPLIFAIFACFETLLAAVYTGIGERALQLGVEAVKRRTSFRRTAAAATPRTRTSAGRWPTPPWPWMGSIRSWPAVAADVDALVDHGAQWFPKLVGLKVRATETARDVVDLAIRVSGGGQLLSAAPSWSGCTATCWPGSSTPSDDESAHNTVANAWLGPMEE